MYFQVIDLIYHKKKKKNILFYNKNIDCYQIALINIINSR